jgi:enoyl-CoA hydratase
MPTTPTEFETLLYKTDGPVATITLNRPDHLNTIVPPMPDEIEKAIGVAERDPTIKVIVLRGAGRAFSGGYDFGGGFHLWGDAMNTDGRWDPGKDFAMVSARETGPTQKFPVDRTKTRHSDGAQLGCRTPAVGVVLCKKTSSGIHPRLWCRGGVG